MVTWARRDSRVEIRRRNDGVMRQRPNSDIARPRRRGQQSQRPHGHPIKSKQIKTRTTIPNKPRRFEKRAATRRRRRELEKKRRGNGKRNRTRDGKKTGRTRGKNTGLRKREGTGERSRQRTGGKRDRKGDRDGEGDDASRNERREKMERKIVKVKRSVWFAVGASRLTLRERPRQENTYRRSVKPTRNDRGGKREIVDGKTA